ncbi:MAG TPA: glycosyltransferase family 39 protein, partial [Chloroflexota bacterium]|nr:glycosyltransferase family 39 protein [Chloroflexota bacterium]
VLWVCLGFALLLARRGVDPVARALLGAVPLVFLLHGLLLHAPMLGRATILSGLDDWLVYESSARDILLNGWLMDGGQGRAPPFYGQPLYPYVLALAHRLTGEGLFGPLTLQFLALGLVVVGTAVLARRAFSGWTDGLVAAACLLVLLQLEAEHFKVARQLFTENVYMPLVMASLVTVVGLARRSLPPRWWLLLGAGGLLGLTAIARSQFLLFVPFGLLVLVLVWRRRAVVPVALMVAGMVLCIAPVTARNIVVSGQLVAISSSGGASLLEFHRPPAGLVDGAALARDPLFEALHLDTSTRTVLAFVRADPGGYVATLLPLGAHSVGLRGRNDPGVHWALLVTCLAYVAAFALRRTRRLWVWPIHAFVFSHLVVLMLFEADTYGYRLVMPMYAPMVAVAAQLPLALLRWAFARRRAASQYSAAAEEEEQAAVPVAVAAAAHERGQRAASLRSLPVNGQGGKAGNGRSTSRRAQRAQIFAVAGWSLVAAGALIWQGKTVLDIWPQREAALHGLGGVAVLAVGAADRASAEAIYVASIDGTPRRFGAGTLTGLRWPWIKWFDPARSLPVPGTSGTAVYVLNELTGHDLQGDLTRCLGVADANGILSATDRQVTQQCANAGAPLDVTFDGTARIRQISVPTTAQAGDGLEARVLWQPLVAHPEPQQISLQLDDPQTGDGTLWGNGTLEPYPASEWQTDEAVLTRIPVNTDGTALPQAYRMTLGIGPTKPGAPQATATWQGTRQERIPVASVVLTPGPDARVPADMRAVDGPTAGGIQLVATRPLPEEAAVGGPLRIGLVWRAAEDQPRATEFLVRLVRGNGEVAQETRLPLLG